MPKILIVDDQNGVRSLLQLYFNEEGFEVATAINGRDALRQVERWQPDVVIMDIKMPIMGGLEALPQIKAILPNVPVIVMTAYVEATSLKKVRNLGASEFIYKPFDLEELRAKVFEVLEDMVPSGRKIAP